MKEIADTLPPKPNEERPGFWIPNEVDVVRFLEDYLKHRILQINKRLQVAYTHAQVRLVEKRQGIPYKVEDEIENRYHVTTCNDTGEKKKKKSVSQN